MPLSAAAAALPAAYRRLENLHVLFWLLKDLAWCLVWQPLGLAMVVPTLAIAVLITWRSRTLPAEYAHNLAIVCWIVANSYWMTSEFFDFDTWAVAPGINGKQLALLPFLAGLSILGWYYLVQLPRTPRAAE